MPTTTTRDAVHLRTLHGGIATAYPPLFVRATTETWPAAFMGHEFSKEQAELLARTVAPQLFPEEGEEPWRKPVREIYKDLQETVQSYTRELSISAADEEARDTLSGLLEALNGTLSALEDLL